MLVTWGLLNWTCGGTGGWGGVYDGAGLDRVENRVEIGEEAGRGGRMRECAVVEGGSYLKV